MCYCVRMIGRTVAGVSRGCWMCKGWTTFHEECSTVQCSAVEWSGVEVGCDTLEWSQIE